MASTCNPETCETASKKPKLFKANCSTFMFPHNDWLMYILYYEDAHLLEQIINSAITSIKQAYHKHQCVLDVLAAYTPAQTDSINILRVKLLVLLDTDEESRNRLCAFASETIKDLRCLCPLKASTFFEELHSTLLPEWVQDECKDTYDLLEAVRDAYLVS